MRVSPPVHQQRDWRHLQRAAVAAHRALGAMVQKNFRAQFSCAASIAVWILQHRPDLAARPHLHVLVACASDFEALDGGRWLQFIPWLLGRPGLVLTASIVGDVFPPGTGEPLQRLRTHAGGLVKDRPPAELLDGTVGDWRRAVPGRRTDLCVVFSPEFARRHAVLLGEEGVLPLLRDGVPLALFSATEAEQLVDVYILRAFGLELDDAQCWPNPWALDPAGGSGDAAYAGMGWSGACSLVPARLAPDAGRLLALDAALEYVRDLLDLAGDDAFLTLGEPIRAAGADTDADPAAGLGSDSGRDGHSVLLRLPGGVAVDSANGHVYQIQATSAVLLGSVPPLPGEAFETFPGHDDLVARAMWSVAAHRDHVLPHVTALDQALRAVLAAA